MGSQGLDLSVPPLPIPTFHLMDNWGAPPLGTGLNGLPLYPHLGAQAAHP